MATPQTPAVPTIPQIDPNIHVLGHSFNIYGVIIAIVFLMIVLGMFRGAKKGMLDWRDMISRDGIKVSPTKVFQLVGGIVSTWIVIQLTLQEKLTWDILATYLLYVTSADGYAKFIMAKYGLTGSDDSNFPFKKDLGGSVQPQNTNSSS